MKKILIFIITIMFLMAAPPVCKALNAPVVPLTTDIDVVSNDIFYYIKELFLYSIIEDMSFLEETRPTSWEAMLEDLHKLKYISGDEYEKPTDLSEFYKKGGDCDDFAMYTVARLFQLGEIPGVLVLGPINPEMKGHITAITLSPDKDTILVIDATSENKEKYVTDMKAYITCFMRTGFFKSCRLMWFHPGSRPTNPFDFFKDE